MRLRWTVFANALPTPEAASVAPPTGDDGGLEPVTITGSGFVTGATVTFGGLAATSVVVVNGTTITCDTPAHAVGAVDVVVLNPDGQLATLASGFTYAIVSPAATPLAWLRADYGVTLVSGRVSAWLDRSGNANNFAQTTAGKRPLLNAAALNGRDTFSLLISRGDQLDGPTPPAPTSGYSVVLVAKVITNSAFGMLISRAAVDELRLDATATAIQYASVAASATGTTDPAGSWLVLTGRHSTTGINVSVGTSQEATAVDVAPSGASQIVINNRAGGAFYTDMDLAEVFIFARALSNADRDAIVAYAVARYGI